MAGIQVSLIEGQTIAIAGGGYLHPKARELVPLDFPFFSSFHAGLAYGNLCRLSLTHLGVSSNHYVYMEELRLLDHPPSPPPPRTQRWPPLHHICGCPAAGMVSAGVVSSVVILTPVLCFSFSEG